MTKKSLSRKFAVCFAASEPDCCGWNPSLSVLQQPSVLPICQAAETVSFDAVFGGAPTPCSGRLSCPPLTLSRRRPSLQGPGFGARITLDKAAPLILLTESLKLALFAFWQLPGSYLRATYALSLSKMTLRSILSTPNQNALPCPQSHVCSSLQPSLL